MSTSIYPCAERCTIVSNNCTILFQELPLKSLFSSHYGEKKGEKFLLES